MNERIKELAKQSGIWFVTNREDLLGDFAELIIKECVTELSNYKLSDPVTGVEFDTDTNALINDQIHTIKGHFGL